MQDEYGRPLSEDGQWVWDGSAWRPTGGDAGAAAQASGTVGYEPTMVAPRDYGQTGGQPEQPYNAGYQGYQGYQGGAPGPYGPGGPGPYGPGGPGGPTPFYKKPVVIIGALLVISAVLVTVILLTRGGGDNSANTTPTTSPSVVIPSNVPTTLPTEVPTTEPPTDTPPTDVATTPPASTTIDPGFYECTSGGTVQGSITFAGNAYTTNTSGTGTYTYDEATGEVDFTGGDLSDFVGTYDPSGPSLDLQPTGGGATLHCAQ